MGKVEKIDKDGTRLINMGMVKHWRCPYCQVLQKPSRYATEMLLKHGKYIEHCSNCGALHYWELCLTDDFKFKTVQELMRRVRSEQGRS